MIKKILLPAVCVITLSACQTSPQMEQLQSENKSLQGELNRAQQQIDTLKTSETLLKQEVAELNRVVGVLGQEKSSRVEESTSLRGDVRQFAQAQMLALKQFLLQSNLVDYIGGELVERSAYDEKPVLVVDLVNKAPRSGSLSGVAGYFHSAGSLSVKVLRPVNDQLVVVWESAALAVESTGAKRIAFPVSVGVDQGDVIAYYLPQPGMVGFDQGTGDSRQLNKDIHVGDAVSESSLLGKDKKRAYSLGVYGLLNTQ